jgi:hypothetical protein
LQEQGEIENKAAGEPLGPKRGIGAVVAAVFTVDWGENSTPTVVGVVVAAGMLLAVFETYETLIGTAKDSATLESA